MAYEGDIITKLSDEDIGKYVTYINIHKIEAGKIKSFDNDKQIAWVVFQCSGNRDKYMDYTGQSCRYLDLHF